ncbi:glycosyltransferase [Bacillus sp. AFS017336]|uniref:glycosyltransferase n=1 Tax=Bacillus sp. AFS017336 TaxID=2033489 RepID=UPI000BF093CA|nr:glycosyltransferase [Bacillus sp. AFS017336]PEL13549.1 hypothetical protein CN601_03840 [Bacillus sp. AFS017336]
MRILFIVKIDENWKTGLFTATHERIKNIFPLIDPASEVYCIKYFDGWFIKLIKYFFRKNVIMKGEESFTFENIKYKNIYYKNTLTLKIFNLLGIDSYRNYFLFKQQRCSYYKFDLVSSHWAVEPASLAYYVYKKTNKSYTITSHGSDIHTLPNKSKKLRNIIKRNLLYSKCNIFVSRALKKDAEQFIIKDKKNISIPNGIDFNKFKMLEKLDIINKSDFKRKVVGYVGNFLEVKRVDALPDIIYRIQKEYGNEIIFILIGDGKLKKDIEKKCLSLGLNVIFTGKLPPNEVVEYYNAMDVLMLPSRKEGLGCVAIEAQACGVPVVGSSNGGIPEALRYKELIVKESNDFNNEFSDKVLKVLDCEYKISKLELINFVHKNFEKSLITSKELDVYNNLLNING